MVIAVPMGGSPDSTVIRFPDRAPSSEKDRPYANYAFVSPGYFASVAAPLLRGRDFLDTDTAQAPHVTVINRAMARKFWPGENPLGKQVGVANPRFPARTIVGIVADIKQASLREDPAPEMYVPYTQNEIKIWPPMQTMQFALRGNSDPVSLIESARSAVHAADAGLPIARAAALSTLVDDSMAQPRFAVLLLASFGALTLVLAAIGLYGVVSYSVAQRTREIGVRMAMGAAPERVFRMVLGQGARLSVLGIGIGLAGSLVVSRLISSFLYQVPSTDPITFGGVSVLLILVALLACYVPARRATRVDPMTCLREE